MFINYSQNAGFPFFKGCMFNILSLTPSITEFIQGSSNFFPTFIQINTKRKSILKLFEFICFIICLKMFSVNENGTLRINTLLDYDNSSVPHVYNIQVKAFDGGDPPQTSL